MGHLRLYSRYTPEQGSGNRDHQVVQDVPPECPVSEGVLHGIVQPCRLHLCLARVHAYAVEALVDHQVARYHEESENSKIGGKVKGPGDLERIRLAFGYD